MRDFRREALLVPQAGAEAAEQGVEGRGQRRQFVVRLPEGEAAVQVVLAPVLRLLGHPRHGAQGAANECASANDEHEQDHRVEHQQCDQGDVLCVLVGSERHSRDHHSHPPSLLDDRLGEESRVGGRVVPGRTSCRGELAGDPLHTERRYRPLDGARGVEQPHALVEEGVARTFADAHVSAVHGDGREDGLRTRAQRVVRISIESVLEDDIEENAQDGQSGGHRHARGKHQLMAEWRRSHSSR